MNAEQLYLELGRDIPGAVESQLFGKPCFKINGKAFMSFFQGEMVFKLDGETRGQALSLEDSKLIDPSGRNRPMKEWVQVSFVNSAWWPSFATKALEYVRKLT